MTDKIKIKRKEYLDNLDPQQKEAVESPISNTSVFAVAGSGKTRLLAYRVANMIDNGIDEESIILLTFTNSAAIEMTDRVQKLLGKNKLKVMTGTFHSVAARFVRRYAKKLKFNDKFSIIGFREQIEIMGSSRNQYMKETYSDNRNNKIPARHVLVEIYSRAIDHNINFYEYMSSTYPYFELDNSTKDDVIKIFEIYINQKRQYNLMDYADLLINFFDLLRMPSVRKEITDKYRHILVDEYQDINEWQFEILKGLNTNDSLFIIGDKSQCIYQFRGADDKYVDDFDKVFKDVNNMFLTYNYRSTPEILRIAESSINNNKNKFPIKLTTLQEESGLVPEVIGFSDEREEYKYIAKEIMRLVAKEGYQYGDIAVLVKKKQDSVFIEGELSKMNIPYSSAGGVDFFSKRYIMDMLAFAQFIDNPSNETAFSRVLNLFDGVGNVNFKVIFNNAKSINFQLSKFNFKLSSKPQAAMDLLLELYNKRSTEHISVIMQGFLDKFYLDYLVRRQMSSDEKIDDINFLIDVSKEYETAKEFLDSSSLKSYKRVPPTNKNNEVDVYTIHKAKGREWDCVIIPNINKGQFPHSLHSKSIGDERKLFYVAMTRAKKSLKLLFSSNYMREETTSSKFIEELDQGGLKAVIKWVKH